MLRHTIVTPKVARHPVRAALWSALGTATLILACSAAAAEETSKRRVVRYADLDLSSSQDAKKLYTRLQRASDYVCRELEGRDLAKVWLRQQCYDEALTNAVADVDHAMVTALHAGKNVRLAQRRAAGEPRS